MSVRGKNGSCRFAKGGLCGGYSVGSHLGGIHAAQDLVGMRIRAQSRFVSVFWMPTVIQRQNS